MKLVLDIYEDDTLTNVKRTVEADRVKIPYRVAIYLISSLESVNIKNDTDLINVLGGSVEKLDKIIKATFGVSENELECIDAGQLGGVAMELYKWAMDKIKEIRGNGSKNEEAAAPQI